MDAPPVEGQTPAAEASNGEVPTADMALPPPAATSPAIAAIFACHDLLVEIASHLAPASDTEDLNGFHVHGRYEAIERFTRVSRTCREAGTEALYSSIHLRMCNPDATLLLFRTLKDKPYLGTLVRFFDAIPSHANDHLPAGPTFGWRAVIPLLECMPNVTRVRTRSSEVTSCLEGPTCLAKLDTLQLDYRTGGRDRWGGSLVAVIFTQAEVRLMSRTTHVVISGDSDTVLRGPAAMPAGLDQAPAIRSLHLRGCAFSPALFHNLLCGYWAGVITSLTIADTSNTDGVTPTWTATPWHHVIKALRLSLTHLRIDTASARNKTFKIWQLDLTCVAGLLHLQLDFGSAVMPDVAHFPASLHYLEIRARSAGMALHRLLEQLGQVDCLPALRAIPRIVRPQPLRSVETLQYEESVFAARDIALAHLQARGLPRMIGGDERDPQIWDESAQAHREAVLEELAGSADVDEPATTGMWEAATADWATPIMPVGQWVGEPQEVIGNAWNAGNGWGAGGGADAWGGVVGGGNWGAAQGADAVEDGWGWGGGGVGGGWEAPQGNAGLEAGLGVPGGAVVDAAGDPGPGGEGGNEVDTEDETLIAGGGEDLDHWGTPLPDGTTAVLEDDTD